MDTSSQRDDLSDIDPQLVSFIQSHADVFIGAKERVESILKLGDRRVQRADQNLRRNLTSGMDEKLAAEAYEQELADADREVQTLFEQMKTEYKEKYLQQVGE